MTLGSSVAEGKDMSASFAAKFEAAIFKIQELGLVNTDHTTNLKSIDRGFV